MNTFFTADTHFGHDGIIAMCSRPFDDIEQHDLKLIDMINHFVQPNDRLFVLGDFAWRAAESYSTRIACNNLHLIWGNHDKANFAKNFRTAEDVTELKFDDIKVFLSHYPHAYWPASHYGSIHLYGHLHSEREETLDTAFPGRRSMDVGIDNAKRILGFMRPFKWEEIRDRLMAQPGHDPVEFYRHRQRERNAA